MNWLGWALLSALFAALTAILAKVGVEGVNSNLATAIRTTVILVFTWSIVFFTSDKADWSALGSRTWFFLVASGLATGLSWLCYFRALQLGEVSKVAPIDKLSVALAIVLAVIFLGERLKTHEIVGASLIVLGAIVLAIKWVAATGPVAGVFEGPLFQNIFQPPSSRRRLPRMLQNSLRER